MYPSYWLAKGAQGHRGDLTLHFVGHEDIATRPHTDAVSPDAYDAGYRSTFAVGEAQICRRSPRQLAEAEIPRDPAHQARAAERVGSVGTHRVWLAHLLHPHSNGCWPPRASRGRVSGRVRGAGTLRTSGHVRRPGSLWISGQL